MSRVGFAPRGLSPGGGCPEGRVRRFAEKESAAETGLFRDRFCRWPMRVSCLWIQRVQRGTYRACGDDERVVVNEVNSKDDPTGPAIGCDERAA